MRIFQLRPRFSETTGEKLSTPIQVEIGVCCDYCGHFFALGDEQPDPAYHIIESGNIETQYDQMELKVDDKRINLCDLYETHPNFHYCQDWINATEANVPCEKILALEWVYQGWDLVWEPSAVQSVKDYLHKLGLGEPLPKGMTMLAHVMYEARHRVIHQLLKKYSMEQLGLEFK